VTPSQRTGSAPRLLIGSDLDGTILTRADRPQLSERTIRAVAHASRSGIALVLCTGRMLCSALPFYDALNLDTPLITHNGAVITHPPTRATIAENTIPALDAARAIRFARQSNLAVNYYADDKLYAEAPSWLLDRYRTKYNIPVDLVDDLTALAREPTKLLILLPEHDREALFARAAASLDGPLTVTSSEPEFVEIIRNDVSKGAAFDQVRKHMGVPPEHTIAIGDGLNDLPLLLAAHLPVAVEDSREELRACAKRIIPSPRDEGVAMFLEDLVARGPR